MRKRNFPLVILILLVLPLISLSGCELTGRETGTLVDFSLKLLEKLISQGELRQRQEEAAATAANLLSGGQLYQIIFTDPDAANEEMMVGGAETYLIALINAAQISIDVAFFQFDLDSVADALLAAQERGVRVRLVYDDQYALSDPQTQTLLDAGIPAMPDLRDAYMHNKFFVIDRLLVWTGSTNITVNGFYRNDNNAVILASPQIADDYTLEFEEMFGGAFGPTSPADTPFRQVAVGDALIEVYFSPEDKPDERLVELLSSARHSIHFMSYVFTNAGIGETVLERARAGVEVSGIFESRSANDQYSECPVLLGQGVDVRLDANPSIFHHKVMIIDSAIVVTGSFNFSNNAITSNDENVLFIHDPLIAGLYEEEFYRQMARSITPVGDACLAPE